MAKFNLGGSNEQEKMDGLDGIFFDPRTRISLFRR